MQAVDRGALKDLAGEALLFQGVEEREKVRFVVLIEPRALDDVGRSCPAVVRLRWSWGPAASNASRQRARAALGSSAK